MDHMLRARESLCPGKAQCIRTKRRRDAGCPNPHTHRVISLSEADSHPLKRQRKQEKLG